MIGVTIGIGEPWKEIAHNAARRMQEMTGVPCKVIDSLPWEVEKPSHPSWLKCRIVEMFPEDHAFLIFDADIFCLNPWDPGNFPPNLGRSLCAVPDRNLPMVYDECCEHQLPFPDWYVNAGLVIFGREHQPVWDATWARRPKYGRWLEQTAFNKAIQETKTEVCRLPRIFNTLPDPVGKDYTAADLHALKEKGVVNFHYADRGNDPERLLKLQKEFFT